MLELLQFFQENDELNNIGFDFHVDSIWRDSTSGSRMRISRLSHKDVLLQKYKLCANSGQRNILARPLFSASKNPKDRLQFEKKQKQHIFFQNFTDFIDVKNRSLL